MFEAIEEWAETEPFTSYLRRQMKCVSVAQKHRSLETKQTADTPFLLFLVPVVPVDVDGDDNNNNEDGGNDDEHVQCTLSCNCFPKKKTTNNTMENTTK